MILYICLIQAGVIVESHWADVSRGPEISARVIPSGSGRSRGLVTVLLPVIPKVRLSRPLLPTLVEKSLIPGVM